MRTLNFCQLALLVLALVAGTAFADQIRVTLPDGSTKDFDGVEVIALQRDETGNGTFQVRMPDGAAHPVELARTIAISFGNAGEGRQYDLVVNTADGPRPFAKSILRHYTRGVFAAVAFGEQNPSAIPAANLIAIASAGAASGAVSMNPDDLLADPSDEPDSEATTDLSSTTGSTGSGTGGPGLGNQPKDPREAYEQMIAQMRANGTSPGLAMTFVILYFVLLGWAVFTSTWCMVHAFSKGNVWWGLGIAASSLGGILLCCCWPPTFMGLCTLPKTYYMRQYETPYRTFISGAVTGEALIYVILSVMKWIL